MAMTFPSNPTTGQQYSVSGGPTYTWDGTVWKILTPGSQFSEQQFTATAGQTSFTVSGGYVIGAVDVYRNGVKLVVGVDFLATDLSTVVLTNAASAGDTIEVVKAAQILYADALKATNNLSDVGNAATALSNLGGLSKTGPVTVSASAPNGALSIDSVGLLSNFASSGDYRGIRTFIGTPGTFNPAANGTPDRITSGIDLVWYSDYWRIGATRSGGAEIADLVVSKNGTKILGVDVSGRLTLPSQPAFHAYRTTAWNSGNGVIAYWDSVPVNRGGHFNSGNGRFTAPVAGAYFFLISSIGSYNQAQDIYLKVNGGTVAYMNARPDSTNVLSYSPNSASSGIMNLNAGDYVEFSTTGNLYSDGNSWIRFGGYLIG